MRKRKYIIMALFLFASFATMQKSFAKYVMQDDLSIGIYLDKTPPSIVITSGGTTESFQKSSNDIGQKKADMTIHTNDNVQIKQNLYQYHPSEPNFEEVEGHEFENGKIFSEEGFYKIVAVDTSGNQTEIIILLDKSAPEILVQYFKKGQASLLKQTAGIQRNFSMENILNSTEENNDEIQENANEIVAKKIQELEPSEENEPEIAEEEVAEEKIQEIEESEAIQEDAEKTTEVEVTEEKMPETEVTQEIIEDTEEIIENNEIIEESQMIKTDEKEEIQVLEEKTDDEIMLMAAGDSYVGSEAEFRNALAIQASVIHIRQSIDFTSPIYINYTVTIVNEGITNSLRYGNGGSFIVVQNGGSLVLSGIVVDTNSSGVGGMVGINVQQGGYVTFINSSIVDGGLSNTGILINDGGTLLLWSSEILRCGCGINLQMNGKLQFATQAGRLNNFYSNVTAILIDNFYGTCNFNENISIHDNSEYGIYIANSSGNINISTGTYYNNTYCIRTCNIVSSSVIISGGSYYSNGWAIWVGGNVNLRGGSIYNNYYGVFLHQAYSGNFHMEGGSIFSNTSSAILQNKQNDGSCTITGGSISGEIYLDGNDNYVNTISSYPSLTVTPSSYYFKRKLVRTISHDAANSEISKVTVTPKDAWYKYIDNEYIVLWSGGNVIARYKDYYGNVIKQEILNGAIGTNYSLTAPTISGYDLISMPSNMTGVFTQDDIFVDFKYDFVNVAKVTFEDLLSGVVSAKYWYHANSENFVGEGIDFANGSVFEKYGYYKIIVKNGVGLEKEVKFLLNKDSLIR